MIAISALAFAVAAVLNSGAVLPKDSVWYRATHLRDLTGDGIADTLILQAAGRRVDSLTVTILIRSRGHRIYRETWFSTWYFQYDAPIDSIDESVKRERVFRHLREFFDAQSFGSLDTAGTTGLWRPTDSHSDPRSEIAFYLKYDRALDSLTRAHMDSQTATSHARKYAWRAAVDTGEVLRAWREMVRKRPVTFTIFAGGENTHTIAWSEHLRRFVVVSACC